MEMHPARIGQHLRQRFQRLQPSQVAQQYNHEGKRQREENWERQWEWPHLESTLHSIVSSAAQNKRASGASTPKAPSIADVR